MGLYSVPATDNYCVVVHAFCHKDHQTTTNRYQLMKINKAEVGRLTSRSYGMANTKSPINLLQELLIKEGCTPIYNFMETRMDMVNRQFICIVSCKGLNESGTGISKKEAKQNAAKNMLLLLAKNNKISLSGDTLPLPSAANIEQSSAKDNTLPLCKQSTTACNYVGMLQEFCQQHKIDPKDILYEVISEEGPTHLRTYTISVSVGSLRESGTAQGKKSAKQEAARRLLLI